MEFIDILIYILASFGLLFTMFSIMEANNCINCGTHYCVDNMENKNNTKILVKISGFEKAETNNIIEKIKEGNYNNIYDIADSVKIMKYN